MTKTVLDQSFKLTVELTKEGSNPIEIAQCVGDYQVSCSICGHTIGKNKNITMTEQEKNQLKNFIVNVCVADVKSVEED